MKNGVDPKAVGQEFQAGSNSERFGLARSYKDWTVAGAKAQGAAAYGWLLIVLGIAVAGNCLALRFHSIAIYAACTAVAIVGVQIVRVSFRRERAWRQANPFEQWRRGE